MSTRDHNKDDWVSNKRQYLMAWTLPTLIIILSLLFPLNNALREGL